jgi:hypothetical protein
MGRTERTASITSQRHAKKPANGLSLPWVRLQAQQGNVKATDVPCIRSTGTKPGWKQTQSKLGAQTFPRTEHDRIRMHFD